MQFEDGEEGNLFAFLDTSTFPRQDYADLCQVTGKGQQGIDARDSLRTIENEGWKGPPEVI